MWYHCDSAVKGHNAKQHSDLSTKREISWLNMPDPSNYVVRWICAVMTQYVAVQVFLDEEHEGPTFVSPNDTKNYKQLQIRQDGAT